jgi:hypothetical protein
MRSQRLLFLFCLALSIAVHAALFETAKRYGIGGGDGSGLPRKVQKKEAELTILPADVQLPAPPQPQWGEHGGQGESLTSSEGEQPQSALRSRPDQAQLSRDPTGNGPVAMATPPQPLSQPLTSPPQALPAPEPSLSKAPAFRKPNKPDLAAQQTPEKPQEQPKPLEQPSPQQPTQQAAAPTPPADLKKASPAAGAPVPHSERDSDAFARETSVEFKRGQVSARNGRETKIARPRANLGAMVEAAEISFPARMVFSIEIDNTGKVRRASLVRSCGSPSIDRAFLLAMYDSWFEPTKDAAGKPSADQFQFTMVLSD